MVRSRLGALREQEKLTVAAQNTARDGTPNARREMFFDIFWKNYWSTSYQSKFSWCLGRLSWERINNKPSQGWKTAGETFEIQHLKRTFFFPPYIFSLYHLNSIFFHVSLKLRCNGRQARGEKKGIGIQRIQLKIELILEVNEVNKCKNILCVIQKLAFCLPPMEMKIGSAKSDIKTVQTCIRCYCSLIIAMFFYFQFNFL